MAKCKYCTGKDRDREMLLISAYTTTYVTSNNMLLIFDGHNRDKVAVNIEYCPKCGREL